MQVVLLFILKKILSSIYSKMHHNYVMIVNPYGLKY